MNISVKKMLYGVIPAVLVLMIASTGCSKKLEAGDPLPLIYKNVYLVGDATPAGWNIDSAKAMTRSTGNSDIFTWTGPLKAGEIKFPTLRNWNSDSFMSLVAGQPITDSKAQLAPNARPDIHWKLTASEAGNYKITLDIRIPTVSFEKVQN